MNVSLRHGVLRRIHIIGSVGSGKTTLAKILSEKLDIPFFELDNVVWKRDPSGDIRRNKEERNAYLSTIVESDSWIIEGVHYGWVSEAFLSADLIIFLDTDYRLRIVRIIKRFIKQKLGMEAANYKPNIPIFRMMFIWNRQFEHEHKPKILEILQQYKSKRIILTDNKSIDDLVEAIVNSESYCRRG